MKLNKSKCLECSNSIKGISLLDTLMITLKSIREFSHFDIIVEGGGEEILDYRRIARANSGLTGAQELPLYSNISEGIGVFSSKYNAKYENFGIRPETRDSLAQSPIMRGLNFVD